MDKEKHPKIGIVGLGTMGCNLALNIAEHGFAVVGYDKNKSQVDSLQKKSEGKDIQATSQLSEFIQALTLPHIILILVPAGKPVDSVIHDLLPHLQAGDILIDGGNSYFTYTELRQKQLEEKQIKLLGAGISGGEKGARHGPCIMPGGDKEAYEYVRPIFEAIAAHVAGEPCVTYIGTGASGHYVKMVHNGIEYGLMELIAETYNVLKIALGFDNEKLHHLYSKWNQTEIRSFLLEITARIFSYMDPNTHHHLIDQIIDIAEQKGTGSWTSEEGMKLHEPLPTINAAVAMRDISVFKSNRLHAHNILKGPSIAFDGDQDAFISQLHHALYAGILMTYIEGMSLLHVASRIYGYQLNLEKIARIWRGGCIIHSALLDRLSAAFHHHPDIASLFFDPYFAEELSRLQEDLRTVISRVAEWGIPIPGLMAALSYYDAYRSSWLPANLIQAQRDYFGSHTYKRIDKKGTFHTNWDSSS